MPVLKCRSVEEMPGTPRLEPGSPEHLDAIRRVWRRAAVLHPIRRRPGVRRYRSVEDPARDAERGEPSPNA